MIAISLLASASFIATSHAAALDDTALTVSAGAGKAARSMPATLDQLEIFLRKNCGSAFPEVGFREFCAPFKPEFLKLKKLDQLRAQNAAIDTLGQMVALGYCSFDQELVRLKIPTPHFADHAAFRPEAMAHYKRYNHSHFLKFQEMITWLLAWAQTKTGDLAKDAKAALTQPYGSSTALKIAWLRDNVGIVPAPLDGGLKKIIYSSPTPYGDWGDDYQRTMVFIDGTLTAAPGIHIYTKDGKVFKFIRENGLRNGFVTSPLTMRMGADHPIILTLLGSGAFRVGPPPTDLSTFLMLPTTPLEDKEFEAVFLEELMAELSGGKPPFAEAFIATYLQTIECVEENVETSPDTTVTDASRAIVPQISPLKKYIDSLCDERIRAEQAEICRQVAEGSIVGKIKNPKKKQGKHQKNTQTSIATSSTVTEPTSEEKEALRKEILSKLKERGRTKWRTLAQILIAALKSAHSENTLVIKVAGKGSHFMLHIAGETSSAGATIIRPHGKADRTLAAGVARGLADNLIELTFKLIAQRP